MILPLIVSNQRFHASGSRPPFSLRWLLLLVVLWGGGVAVAGDSTEGPQPIQAGETRTAQLSGEGPVIFAYTAAGGEVITVTARSLSGGEEYPEDSAERRAARDPVIDVLGPDGVRLAYNHRHRTTRDDLNVDDAVISRLRLAEAGTYHLRVNTYGGSFRAEIEITLETDDRFQARIDRQSDERTVIRAALPRLARYTYAFEASAGQQLTITARDTSHTLDPLLWLLAPDDEPIAFNDDHGSADTALDVLDARIAQVSIPVDGVYTVVVVDFLGRAGTFELVIEWIEADNEES
jgi:hypothetical protein